MALLDNHVYTYILRFTYSYIHFLNYMHVYDNIDIFRTGKVANFNRYKQCQKFTCLNKEYMVIIMKISKSMQNCTWISRFIIISMVGWLFLVFRKIFTQLNTSPLSLWKFVCTTIATDFEKEQSIAYIYILTFLKYFLQRIFNYL